jgi:hypothetical protein
MTPTESDDEVAGRSYPKIYRVQGKQTLQDAISAAIEAGGGRVLYSSSHKRAPFYFGVETVARERLGLLVYAFTMNKRDTTNRPSDEHRGFLRYGAEETWHSEDHPVAVDVAGVDTTLVLGVNVEDGYFLGLDPALWNPLPMGISFMAKDADIEAMGEAGWHAWEKDNHAGVRREARSPSGLESRVAFRPERFLDYARYERDATALGLDTSLRLVSAEGYRKLDPAREIAAKHVLEEQFGLTSRQILEIIATRNRLAVAVRGGVAEYHLESHLQSDQELTRVERRDKDGEPDFEVELKNGPTWLVECKNVSPTTYADGSPRIETQKTRSSKGDPASRFYKYSQFDVVAACLFSVTGKWEFRFIRAADLSEHNDFEGRLAPMHRVDDRWKRSVRELA